MLIDEIINLINQGESNQLEFKSMLPPVEIVARNIAAFANSEGGLLVIGVNDNGEIIGISDDTLASSVVESSLLRLNPKPEVNHTYVSKNDKQLYVIEVKKSLEVVLTENQTVYLRQGPAVFRANAKEATKLINEKTW